MDSDETTEEVSPNEDHETVLLAAVRMLKWLVVILIVVSAGNLARSFVNQQSTDKATQAAERVEATSIEGRDASVETLKELRQILANLEAADEGEPDLSNQAILDALQAIARIEGFVCGGPCPQPGG